MGKAEHITFFRDQIDTFSPSLEPLRVHFQVSIRVLGATSPRMFEVFVLFHQELRVCHSLKIAALIWRFLKV